VLGQVLDRQSAITLVRRSNPEVLLGQIQIGEQAKVERYLVLMRVDKVTRRRNNVPQCQDLGKALARRTEANDHMHPTQVLLSALLISSVDL